VRLGAEIDPEALPAVARLLRDHRKQTGMLLKEVARDSGVSISHLSKLENGKRVAVSKRAIGGIASALNIPPAELFAAAAILPREVERQIADPELAYAVMDGYSLPPGTRVAMRRIHIAALAARANPISSPRERVDPDQLVRREGYESTTDPGLDPLDVRIAGKEVVCAGNADDPDQAGLIRFELAHAYGHIRLGYTRSCNIRETGHPAEQDATAFAAFILAPKAILQAAAQASRLDVWEDGPGDFIREIAGRLAAPGWLVARRLGEDGLLALAAGLSEA
jgi:transcriptional regulator with XRE-family HTH domain